MQTRIIAAMVALPLIALPAMAAEVNTWSPSAPSNTMAAPNGFPENAPPSTVNDSAREVMAAVRRWQQRSNATVVSGGSANAQTLTYDHPPASCVNGDTYMFIAGMTNTGAMTLNNGACTAPVKLGTSLLIGGEVVTERAVIVVYHDGAWQLLSGGIGPGVANHPLTADDGVTALTADDGVTALTTDTVI